MKTYLLCLRKNEFKGLQAEITISDVVTPLGLDGENCKNFNDAESFFRCLSEIIENPSQVILAVDTDVFLNTKKLLCSALDLNCISSSIISELVSSDAPDRELQCSVPADAAIFPTEDGLFSGFAVKKGNCSIIMLPLDNIRTSQCIDSFYDFLNGTTEAEPVKETADNDLPAAMNSISESAVDACRILKDMGFTATLSVSPAAEKLCKLLPSMEEIKFLSSALERKNSTPKNYAANLAKDALQRSGTKIGASITNAFKVQSNGETKIFVCVAVADSEAAKVKKIYAQPGESALSLTACALDAVLDMIKGQAVRGKTILTEENRKEISNPSPSVAKGTRKKLLIGTACAGAAALALCLGVAVGGIFINPSEIPVSTNSGNSTEESDKSSNSSSNSSKNFWDFLFSSSNDDEDTEDNDTGSNNPDNSDQSDGTHSFGSTSSSGETSANPGTEQGTNPSEPGSESGETPTEQPSGENPTEPQPTEPTTEGGTEPTEKPTEEQPSETEPTEPTAPPTDPVTPPTEPSTEEDTAPTAEIISEAAAE